MKREDVKNKITGITEEQPNWLMQENGSDITREKFLSTLSLRRATTCYCSGSLICNFYPRSPCGERRVPHRSREDTQNISIHALLAESDRGAGADRGGPVPHFYPRSPCGERHLCPGAACSNKLISIHALLAESDAPVGIADGTIQSDFYPRSPCGERLP